MEKQLSELRFALTSFFIGLLAVFFFWATYLFLDDQPFSTAGIRRIHEHNVLLFFLDTLPLLAVFLSWFMHVRSNKQIKTLKEEIETIKEDIEEKAALAKKIGESGLMAQAGDYSEEDILGKALNEMQRALAAAKKRDSEAKWVAETLAELGAILRNHQRVVELAPRVLSLLHERTGAGILAFYAKGGGHENDLKQICVFQAAGSDAPGNELHSAQEIARLVLSKKVPHYLQGALPLPFPADEIKDEAFRISQIYLPLSSEDDVLGLLIMQHEVHFNAVCIRFLLQAAEIIGRTMFNIQVSENTIRLLEESQKMSAILERQQQQLAETGVQLRLSNEELEKKVLELENSRKRMLLLMENASEITTIFDAGQMVLFISPSVKRILGYEPAALIGKKGLPSVGGLRSEELSRLFEQIQDSPGVSISAEFSLQSTADKRVWMEHIAVNLIHDPAIQGVVINSKDISMQRRAELERRRRNQMQSLSENSTDLIIRLNKLGVFYYVNPKIEWFTGNSPEHYINRSLDATDLPVVFADLYEKLLYQVLGTGEKVIAELMLQEEQRRIYLTVTAIPEFNERKETDTVLFVAHDITDRKLSEAEIRRKNTSITDSIRYSHSIQQSLMPTERVFRSYFPDSFLMYQPRDIISGDFPWIYRQDSMLFLAIADCTGHGVPGALLSLVGYFQLNYVAEHHAGASCGHILDMLNRRVREILRQDSEDSMTRDGMDIAILRWDSVRLELEFSGAHRPLLYLDHEGQLCEIKGDRSPIAGFQRKQSQPFSNHLISCKGNEKFFIFTDGFPDQFGGEQGNEKLMMERVRIKILEHRHESAMEIGAHLRDLYRQWMGATKQIDDALLFCFSIGTVQNFVD